ncbi:MAG TPA: dienelactone hydrolase family protein [Verrucomicrobiae bacterium]|jgi:dienelactone hydrolase|nr:dienelactone hydrolase family protein [Verrucomicrobiae bacterium]
MKLFVLAFAAACLAGCASGPHGACCLAKGSAAALDIGPISTNHFDFAAEGRSYPVYWRGADPAARQANPDEPAILLMQELPGLTPACFELATRLATNGYTVYAPLLFGRPGKSAFFRNCVSLLFNSQWHLFAKDDTSPVAGWLGALCQKISQDHGGRGIGVVGNCLSGSLAVALLREKAVIAPVMSQPALPLLILYLPVSAARKKALGLAPADLARAEERCAQDHIQILAFRFENDKISPPDKFAEMTRDFGTNFIPRPISQEDYAAWDIPSDAHAVLTENYDDRPGHPTTVRFQEMIDFLNARLKRTSDAR